MKKLVSVLGLSIFLSASVLAGTATITGSASVSRAPEFIDLTLTIKSECYATPIEAMTANEEAGERVQKMLHRFIRENGVDGVYTNGGHTSEYSNAIYVDGERRELCGGTFQHVNDFKFRTNNVKDFPRIRAEILQEALSNFARGSAESEDARTHVTVGMPMADVCAETRKEMADEASSLAGQDAHHRFSIYAKQCSIMVYDVQSINEANFGYQSSDVSYKEAFAVPGAGPMVEPRFQDIVVSAQVTVEFEFPATSFACESLPKRRKLRAE